ncbi:hypothetical protein SPBR_08275 [Sporothrix brasiliensis 5110]|uniref:Uncharacterized protein n=1 Tax=Sporothrix brasiliensis 5110 TaxID=1398154 RepID=A0A0C2EKB8_9PEZI|nr:uncharacterized protein SPBR_08275 [Sporothrix brasiliensis 5110]KIH86529.1 hypothetical protein SPBR_08275 [Sporothrix brasiliensis 5110]
MKSNAALAAIGFGITAWAAPADTCHDYSVGKSQCYTATITVGEVNPCPYQECPFLHRCRATPLTTSTIVPIPCKYVQFSASLISFVTVASLTTTRNPCCRNTATKTVTTSCGTCPTTCTAMFTETIHRYEDKCDEDGFALSYDAAAAAVPAHVDATPTAEPGRGGVAAPNHQPPPGPTARPIDDLVEVECNPRVLQEMRQKIEEFETSPPEPDVILDLRQQLREQSAIISAYRQLNFVENTKVEMGLHRYKHVNEEQIVEDLRQTTVGQHYRKRSPPPLSLGPDGSVATPQPTHHFGPGGRRPDATTEGGDAAVETATRTPTPEARKDWRPLVAEPDYETDVESKADHPSRPLVKKPGFAIEAEDELDSSSPPVNHIPRAKILQDEPVDEAVEDAEAAAPSPVTKDDDTKTPTEDELFPELWHSKWGHGPVNNWPSPSTPDSLPPVLGSPQGLPTDGGMADAAHAAAETDMPTPTRAPIAARRPPSHLGPTPLAAYKIHEEVAEAAAAHDVAYWKKFGEEQAAKQAAAEKAAAEKAAAEKATVKREASDEAAAPEPADSANGVNDGNDGYKDPYPDPDTVGGVPKYEKPHHPHHIPPNNV